MDHFKKLTMLSLEQATVLPYLTFRLAQEGIRIIRLDTRSTGIRTDGWGRISWGKSG